MGAGFLEAVYQESLEIEFSSQGIPFVPQAELGLTYKDRGLKQKYFADLICMDKIIVEVKALKEATIPRHDQRVGMECSISPSRLDGRS